MTPTPRTSRSRHVTGNEIDRLAREAEIGYDTGSLRRAGGRKPIGSAAARVVPVRLDPELDAALRRRAASDHSTASDVIRDALHAWLKDA